MEDYSKRFNTNDPLRVGQCKNDICFTPSYSDLKHHNQKNNCWVGINGKIYDITKYKKSTKQVLNNYGWRNLEKVGEWLGDFFDYGKKTTSMKTTLRQQLADKNRTGNIQTGRNAPI